jgi:hypothetical protein
VSGKSQRIAQLVGKGSTGGLDPYYQGYFDCFNRGEYYEAHEVLEELWLKVRHGPNGAFYKGLIQLAGAFVHLQKDRLRPAGALFKLARSHLGPYAKDNSGGTPLPLFKNDGTHEHLAMAPVLAMIDQWLAQLEGSGFQSNPLRSEAAPVLRLESIRE